MLGKRHVIVIGAAVGAGLIAASVSPALAVPSAASTSSIVYACGQLNEVAVPTGARAAQFTAIGGSGADGSSGLTANGGLGGTGATVQGVLDLASVESIDGSSKILSVSAGCAGRGSTGGWGKGELNVDRSGGNGVVAGVHVSDHGGGGGGASMIGGVVNGKYEDVVIAGGGGGGGSNGTIARGGRGGSSGDQYPDGENGKGLSGGAGGTAAKRTQGSGGTGTGTGCIVSGCGSGGGGGRLGGNGGASGSDSDGGGGGGAGSSWTDPALTGSVTTEPSGKQGNGSVRLTWIYGTEPRDAAVGQILSSSTPGEGIHALGTDGANSQVRLTSVDWSTDKWLLKESSQLSGYFQIVDSSTSGAANPQCLDVSGADGASVLEYPCKDASSPSVANQLWQMKPGTSSRPNSADYHLIPASSPGGHLSVGQDQGLVISQSPATDDPKGNWFLGRSA